VSRITTNTRLLLQSHTPPTHDIIAPESFFQPERPVTVVLTVAQLRDALEKGAPHIELREHLAWLHDAHMPMSSVVLSTLTIRVCPSWRTHGMLPSLPATTTASTITATASSCTGYHGRVLCATCMAGAVSALPRGSNEGLTLCMRAPSMQPCACSLPRAMHEHNAM
jgi:hypothetical protein